MKEGRMSAHEHPAPVNFRLFTPGVKALAAVALTGTGFAVYRLIFGLAATTNMDDRYPMGLWIGVDEAGGVALAGAGFTASALVYIFRREYFHAIIRPALLTALLRYTFVAVSLMFDLGRWYNIWHPMMPSMWQGNSVLFEVGICVMTYLTILYLEFSPVVLERFIGHVNLPGRLARFNNPIDTMLRLLDFILSKIMFLVVLAGVTASNLHQSSLGALTVIVPYKLHPLYWSRLGPIFFLSSAIAVGFPLIIAELLIISWALKRKPDMPMLTSLSGLTRYLLGLYVALKLGDMLYRGTYVFLFQFSAASVMFWIEFVCLTVLPFAMLLSSDVRRSPGGLLAASLMYCTGVLLNRCAVFFIAYEPLYVEKAYVPALSEFVMTAGLIATTAFLYRAAVTYFPILTPARKA
jgi:Ni/Fe-hydrogenase subunit HybB-like protein